MNKEKFQLLYMFIFMISTIGICGNIELDIITSIHCWIIFIISGLLTIGKIIYWTINKKLF